MTEPTGNVAGGTIDQGLAQAISSAVAAAVTTSMNEITAKLNELESRIKQTSVNEDVNFEANVTGADDPYDDKRRAGIVHNKLSLSMAENADALMKEYLKYTAGVWARSLDHFCATNPEIPPRK
jgi:hypothetical protein